MKIILKRRGGYFIYAQAFTKAHAIHQFISENLITYQISGLTHVINEQGELTLKEGQLILSRRNQFAKSTKMPVENKKCQCVTVILSLDCLQQYALDHSIDCKEKYRGKKMILMEPDDLLKSYFSSIISYADLWNEETQNLAALKVNEVIELLLTMCPDFKSFLFDFTDPNKQDLEAFMLKNFRYNVSLEQFAKLSGRSLTSFKRDFNKVFGISPALWLKNKRLSESLYLIREKNLRPYDFYYSIGFENLSRVKRKNHCVILELS